ncbi:MULTISPECIES: M13 family metallopeptidase [Xanthomonas]|uniref:M13 family metallopeptidase n=1 Tax=Xanthomonas dyei TaxID=743699 RepID=A0ABZ0D8C1_9XANT|nr:M13 family metallopeptidase [Xanthomonas dyei]WOB26533.1 M13 family metallopeptidase [Xanthomonas dyei]WOB54152.1 M13 family metallopeptidase [Xanthomonas dyei]
MPIPKKTTITLAILMALTGCKQAGDQAMTAKQATPSPAAKPAVSALDLNELDTGVDPCQDLNGFANGKALAKGIPANETGIGTSYDIYNASYKDKHAIAEGALHSHAADGAIEQLVGTFYASGMDEATIQTLGLTPIKQRLDTIDALSSTQDIVGFITARHAQGATPLFRFVAQPDNQDTSKMVAYVYVEGLTLPSKDYYSDPQYAAIRQAYLAYITQSFVLAGTPADQASVQAAHVLQLESRLATALLAPSELRDPHKMYQWLSVSEANALTPYFPWDTFMQAQGIQPQKGLALSQVAFLKNFDSLLHTAPVAEWKSYLRFHAIDDAAPALSKPFADNHFAFYSKTLEGRQTEPPRWREVIDSMDATIGEAMGQLYVASKFSAASKQHALELVQNLQEAMRARLERADWMSAPTKAEALKKLANMLPKIGYPDTWRDWSGLRLERGAYLRNIESAAAFNHKNELAKIGKPANRRGWGEVLPQTVNAYYNPTENSIVFPAVILQAPLFDVHADDALNYGGIGGFIGHEISHGFDDKGSQFDETGATRNWWLAADRKAFEARTRKILDQVNGYVPLKSKPELRVNGQLVLGESIADFTGINLAYDALMLDLKKHPERNVAIDGYTPEQRFFINWARLFRNARREEAQVKALNSDPHPPSVMRVNAGPSNMPQFAKAFSCKPGDAMARSDLERAQVW